MDLMPIADHRQDEKQKCDQQQPCGLRSIDGMAMVPMNLAIRLMGDWHAPIVAPKTVT
jgi:hypothetical protein